MSYPYLLFRTLMIVLVTMVVVSATNLISNGDFSSGTSGWDLGVYSGSAQYSVVNNIGKIAITKCGKESWDINLYQRGIHLYNGVSYELSFDVWGEDYRPFSISINSFDGEKRYADFGFNTAGVSSEKKHYTFQFTMLGNDTQDAIIQFTAGLSIADLYIDNVTLTEISDRNPVVKITGGPTINTMDHRPTFTWDGWDDNRVSHYFCGIDNDTPNIMQTTTSFTPIQNLLDGSHTFYVYAVDDSGNISSTISQSFSVGDYKDNNLISNGDFSSGIIDWDLHYSDGAAALGQIDSSMYKVDITQAGENSWEISLSQSGIKLEKGRTYEVSYQAKTESGKWKPFVVDIKSVSDGFTQTVFGSSGYHTIGPKLTTYTYQFIMNHETVNNAAIAFYMGCSNSNVWIDNAVIRDVTPIVNTNPTVTITSSPTGVTTDRRPIFGWSGKDNDGTITEYYCEIDDSTPDYKTISTNYTVGSDLSFGKHTFYVYAVDNDGNHSSLVSTSFFVEDANTNPTVTITSSPSGVTTDRKPTFTWKGSDNGSISTYYCEIDDDTPDYKTLETHYTVGSDLQPGGHTFYVYAVDNEGNKSSVVSTSFTIKGGTITTSSRLDTVTNVIKADSVQTTRHFIGNKGEEDTIVTTAIFTVYCDSLFTIIDSLSDGGWFDADTIFNSEEVRDDTIDVKIDTLKYEQVVPSQPILLYPNNNATDISVSATVLTWKASKGADSYTLQISTTSDFTALEINQSGITSTSFTVTNLLKNTTYYWRVAAENDAGASEYWSSVRNFSTELPIITTIVKNDTITTLINTHSVTIDSSIVGIEDKEDTVVTTTTFLHYSDSLFTITDSLSDGTWFNADTIFNSVEFHNDTTSIRIDTLKYESNDVAIIIANKKSKLGVTDLVISPNPVALKEGSVDIIIPQNLSGNWHITVYDVLGNLIDEAEFSAIGGTIYRWDLCNNSGIRVANGSYVLWGKVTNYNGKTQIFKKIIGVKQ